MLYPESCICHILKQIIMRSFLFGPSARICPMGYLCWQHQPAVEPGHEENDDEQTAAREQPCARVQTWVIRHERRLLYNEGLQYERIARDK